LRLVLGWFAGSRLLGQKFRRKPLTVILKMNLKILAGSFAKPSKFVGRSRALSLVCSACSGVCACMHVIHLGLHFLTEYIHFGGVRARIELLDREVDLLGLHMH
jgi:hypothetical protein